MKFLDMTPRPVFAADDGGAGGADGADGAAGGDGATGADGAAGADGSGAGKWWESDAFSSDDREYLTARGLTTDDPIEALPKIVQAHRNAEKRLGQPADQLLAKPKEGQSLVEWRKENATVFGVPENADGYELSRPELGEGVEWDTAFEAEARALAFEQGMSATDLQPFVDLYGKKVVSLLEAADNDLAQANTEMLSALERDWGDQVNARMAIAKQAKQFVCEKAGLDENSMHNIAMALKPKVGDAGIIRLFEAIGQLMGEDAIKITPGGGSFDMSPAEARQKLSALNGPDGEMAKAMRDGNQAKIAELKPQIQRLSKLAAQ